MSYILDALRKAERERAIAQVPTLMTVHETRIAPSHNRLWLIFGICLVCVAAIVWFAASLFQSADIPASSSNAVARRGQPEAVTGSSPVEATSVPSPERALPSEGRLLSRSQETSANEPRADGPHTDFLERKRIEDQGRTTIPREPQPEPAKATVQRQTGFGAGGTPALPAKNGSPAAPEGTTAENSQSRSMSLREAMAKMKITILVYDEAKSERMVFINDRKYVEGDYVDGRYLLESITPDSVVLSYQGERASLRASK